MRRVYGRVDEIMVDYRGVYDGREEERECRRAENERNL